MNDETEDKFGVLFKDLRYSEAYRMYVDSVVFPEDRPMMLEAGSIGNIMYELRSKKTFLTTYRSDNNGTPHYCEMKFVKVGNEEGAPKAVALGFADKDEELRNSIEQERIRKRNMGIIEVLASEYSSVYYIDLKTDEMTPYTMGGGNDSQFGRIFRSDVKFTDAFRQYAETMVHPLERGKVLNAGSVYNIIEQLHDKKSFAVTFRTADSENMHYCEIKFVKVGESDNPSAVALGFSIVDEAHRREIENKQREEFINGLANDYEAVFHADLINNYIEIVRATDGFMTRNPQLEKRMEYPEFLEKIIYNIVEGDREAFVRALSHENIDIEFAKGNTFFHNYRIIKNESISYTQVKVIHTGEWITEHNFLIGIHDMDEAMRERLAQEEILSQARMEAESANKAKSSFLFNMSHDIRTPMNAIIGFNNMAIKHITETEKVRDYLEKVNMSSQHLLSIINDVLDMARIESGKVTIEEEIAFVDRSANDLVDIVTQSVKDRGLSLITDFSGIEHNCVYCDVLRVNRVLMNLISNAIKYTNPGGTIRYEIHETESARIGYAAFEFTVADNGIGMSKDYLEHVFEAFTRESTSTVSKIQGTGLGMAITKELVDLMQGTINIESEEGKGTTIHVHFDFRIAEESVQNAEAQELDYSSLEGKHVLLVEDNELNREIANEILKEYGMTVEEAEDGSIAVEKIRTAGPGGYDYILMDIQMPVMDGYTATGEIRSLPSEAEKHTPIIAMTANAFAEDKKRALDSGMDAHIAKPINVKELLEKLSACTL